MPPCYVEPLSLPLLAAGNQFNKYLRTAAKNGVGRTRMNVCIINLTLSPFISLSFSRRTIAVKFPCWQAKRSRSRGRKEVETYKARMNSAFAAFFFLPFLPTTTTTEWSEWGVVLNLIQVLRLDPLHILLLRVQINDEK